LGVTFPTTKNLKTARILSATSPPKPLKKGVLGSSESVYYNRVDVRRAILDFACSGNLLRECAFYNSGAKSVQRYLDHGRPVVFDSNAAIDRALRRGATAFYCSYWRCADPSEFDNPLGRDLVWTIRAEDGGLRFAKLVTSATLGALSGSGFQEPWVKYSGGLGFDVIIPLELIPAGAWGGDVYALEDLQRELTGYLADYLAERFERVRAGRGSITIERENETCLLSELRARRGLLLAPMSLNPETGLVSVPLAPSGVAEFSVLDASPSNVRPFGWAQPLAAHGLPDQVASITARACRQLPRPLAA